MKKRKRHIIKGYIAYMYSFCYGDKENSPIFIGVQEIKNGQIQKFFSWNCICRLLYRIFICGLYFEKSIPDQIYVKAGEAIDTSFRYL